MAQAGDPSEVLSAAHLHFIHDRTSRGKWKSSYSGTMGNYILGPAQSWRRDNFSNPADVDEMALLHNAVPELIALLDAIESWKNGAKYGETDVLLCYAALTEMPKVEEPTEVSP